MLNFIVCCYDNINIIIGNLRVYCMYPPGITHIKALNSVRKRIIDFENCRDRIVVTTKQ